MVENSRQIAYALPFLAVLIIAIVDFYLYCSLGIGSTEDWTGIYSIEGLVLDAVGAIIVLSGGLTFLRQFFIPIGKINRIQDARFELLDKKELNASHPGFDDVRSIIWDKARVEDESVEDIVRFKVLSSSPSGLAPMGVGTEYVYPCVEKEDWSREDFPEGKDPKEHPSQRYNRLESVGDHALVDGWFDQEVRNLEQDAKQVPLRVGVLFFLFGFSYQAVGYLITLFSFSRVAICG